MSGTLAVNPGRTDLPRVVSAQELKLGIVERRRDAGDHSVDCGSSAFQRCNRRDRDKADHKRIFHQILTFVTHGQGLEFHEQPEQSVVHLDVLAGVESPDRGYLMLMHVCRHSRLIVNRPLSQTHRAR